MDLDSKNGFVSTVWGPATWHYLHTVSIAYPNNPTESERQTYFTFIQSLCHVLPCRSCREGLVKNLERVPLRHGDLNGRVSFSYWMYRLHNEVNRMLHKPTVVTFGQVCSRHLNAEKAELCIIAQQPNTGCRSSGTEADGEVLPWTCDVQMASDVLAHKDTNHRKWNEAFWLFFHFVSLNFPLEPSSVNRFQYRQFVECLVMTSPPASKWSKCLRSIVLDPSSGLSINQRRLDSRRVFATWVYDVHCEHIRKCRNMPPLPPFDEFFRECEQFRASNCTIPPKLEHGGCVQSAHDAPRRCVVKLQ